MTPHPLNMSHLTAPTYPPVMMENDNADINRYADRALEYITHTLVDPTRNTTDAHIKTAKSLSLHLMEQQITQITRKTWESPASREEKLPHLFQLTSPQTSRRLTKTNTEQGRDLELIHDENIALKALILQLTDSRSGCVKKIHELEAFEANTTMRSEDSTANDPDETTAHPQLAPHKKELFRARTEGAKLHIHLDRQITEMRFKLQQLTASQDVARRQICDLEETLGVAQEQLHADRNRQQQILNDLATAEATIQELRSMLSQPKADGIQKTSLLNSYEARPMPSTNHILPQPEQKTFNPTVPLKSGPLPYLPPAPRLPHNTFTAQSHHDNWSRLDKITKIVPRFTSKDSSTYPIQQHLQTLNYYLKTVQPMDTEQRIYAIKGTSDSEVNRFINRQDDMVRTDYDQLQHALIEEFADGPQPTGFEAAIKVQQQHHERPEHYYQRLRKAYFGLYDQPGIKNDLTLKTIFVENLQPHIKRTLQLTTDTETQTLRQLRDLASKFHELEQPDSTEQPEVDVYSVQARHTEKQRRKPPPQFPNPQPQPQSHTNKSANTRKRKRKHATKDFTAEQKDTVREIVASFYADQENNTQTHQPEDDAKTKNEPDHARRDENVAKFLGRLWKKGDSHRLYLSTTLENSLACDALLDTAADITLMSRSLFDKLQTATRLSPKPPEERPCSLTIQAYSSENSTLSSMATVNFRVGSMDIAHPVYISTVEAVPLLIGKDFLDRFEALIDLQRLELWAQVGKPGPMPQSTHAIAQCYHMRLPTLDATTHSHSPIPQHCKTHHVPSHALNQNQPSWAATSHTPPIHTLVMPRSRMGGESAYARPRVITRRPHNLYM